MSDEKRQPAPLERPRSNSSPAERLNRPTHDEQLLSTLITSEAPSFTQTDSWRVLRIMGEFVDGFESLATLGPAITIFGSARVKPGDPQYLAAVEVAHQLGQAGFTIITGGGPGIMQAGNQGARLGGTQSVGLNIELPFEQTLNPYVDISLEFHYFFVRKTMFVKYAQGFVIFPGGFGTMDELFEALTLIQTGKVRNFPVILYDSSYWRGLLDWMELTMLQQGKIAKVDLALPILADSPEEACQIIVQCTAKGAGQRQEERESISATRDILSGTLDFDS